jgi:hypothetical protein
MKKLDENRDQQEPVNNEPQPAGPSPTIYKSLEEIDPIGTNGEAGFVDRDGTLWMPAPDHKDAYQPIFQDGGPPFLERLTFHFANTMAEVPHWWTKCNKEPPRHDDFWALYEAINKYGVSELWNGRRYKYWYPGNGFRYWHMGPFYRIINRSRAEKFGPVSEELKEKAAEWHARRREKDLEAKLRVRQRSTK